MKRIFLGLFLAVALALAAPVAWSQERVASFAVSLKLHAKAYGYIWFLRLENWMGRQGMILGVNTITNLIPTLYEALDVVSRELVGFIPAVSRNSSMARAALNQTVNIPVVPAIVGGNVTPGATPPSDGDSVMGNTTMTISKSRYWPIRWNGEEQLSISASGMGPSVLRDQFAQAFRAATNEIEADLAALYVASSRSFGTAGTAPFPTNAVFTDFAGAARILDDNGAPGDRRMVLGSAAIANIRGVQAILFKANEAGTSDLLRRGIIGEVQGMMLHNSSGIAAVAKGTGASYTTNSAGYAVGATAITLITGTGTVLAGDNVTFAGDTNIYVVAAGVAAPGVITLAEPGLRVAIAASPTALTVGNASTRNMTFSRSAIQLATRAPALPEGGDMADDRTFVTDPVSGLTFEVSLYRQYRQVKYEVAIAWGQKMVTPRHSMNLLG